MGKTYGEPEFEKNFPVRDLFEAMMGWISNFWDNQKPFIWLNHNDLKCDITGMMTVGFGGIIGP